MGVILFHIKYRVWLCSEGNEFTVTDWRGKNWLSVADRVCCERSLKQVGLAWRPLCQPCLDVGGGNARWILSHCTTTNIAMREISVLYLVTQRIDLCWVLFCYVSIPALIIIMMCGFSNSLTFFTPFLSVPGGVLWLVVYVCVCVSRVCVCVFNVEICLDTCECNKCRTVLDTSRTYWALFLHTTFRDLDLTSRSQRCQSVGQLELILIFSLTFYPMKFKVCNDMIVKYTRSTRSHIW